MANLKMTKQIFKKLAKILALPKNYQVIVTVSLILSIGLISSQRFFNSSLIKTLSEQSSALLTADIEVASTRALSEEDEETISKLTPNLKKSYRQLFSSMIQFYGNETRIAEVVAIDSHYPLRGNCIAINKDGNTIPASKLLDANENGILISSELSETTDIAFGSHIKLGKNTFKVVGIIDEEPDINIQSLSLGPRVYIHLKDTPKLGFRDTTTRKYHSLYLNLSNQTELIDLTDQLTTALNVEGDRKTIQGSYGPSQPIVVRNYRDINRDIIRGFDALNEFYFFLSIFILLLSGSAFGFIIWTSIIHGLQTIGNLRYLGISIRQIKTFYLKTSINIALKTIFFGLILGVLFAQTALQIVSHKLNIGMEFINIAMIDVVFICTFSVLTIVGINQIVLTLINANQLFHQEQSAKSIRTIFFKILLGITGFLLIFLLLNNISLTKSLMLIALFAILFIGLYAIDMVISKLLKKVKLKGSIQTNFAIRYLSENHTLRKVAFIAIGFSVITILSIGNYESSLQHEFNPKNSNKVLPNLFIIDIYKHQVDAFKNIVGTNGYFSPLYRTRIKSINNQSPKDYVKNKAISDAYFLYREQNLSTRSELYETETLKKGTWFNSDDNIAEMSIEDRFVRLKLSLGDVVEFSFVGFSFKMVITSIREVDWGTFKPNFFMIIEPPYLDNLPQTWITAIKTPPETSTNSLKMNLIQQFPNISIIDIEKTSKKIMSFLGSIILAIKIGAIYCFIIGILIFILLGKLFSEMRAQTTNQLFWIGLSKNKIVQISTIENLLFCNIIFVVSQIISIVMGYVLFTFFIPLEFKLNIGLSILIWLTLNGLVIAHSKSNKNTITIGDSNV